MGLLLLKTSSELCNILREPRVTSWAEHLAPQRCCQSEPSPTSGALPSCPHWPTGSAAWRHSPTSGGRMITRPRCCSLSGSPSHPDTERQTVGWTHSINITGLYLLCSEAGVHTGGWGWTLLVGWGWWSRRQSQTVAKEEPTCTHGAVNLAVQG